MSEKDNGKNVWEGHRKRMLKEAGLWEEYGEQDEEEDTNE